MGSYRFFIVICFLLVAGCGDSPKVSEYSHLWEGFDHQDKRLLFKLKGDGRFVLSHESFGRDYGRWSKLDNEYILLTDEYYIDYVVTETGGDLVLKIIDTQENNKEYLSTLNLASACGDVHTVCRGEVICYDRKKREFIDQSSQVIKNTINDYGKFSTLFICSLERGLKNFHSENIEFPLATVKYENAPRPKGVTYNYFKYKSIINGLIAENEYKDGGLGFNGIRSITRLNKSYTGYEGESISILHKRETGGIGVNYSTLEFSNENGEWRLVKQRACEGGSCPASLFCLNDGNSDFSGLSEAGENGFYRFYNTFYCSIKSENSDLYKSRLKEVIEFEWVDTEGGDKFLESNVNIDRSILLGDGRELYPEVEVQESRATVYVNWDGTGISSKLDFELIQSKWFLSAIYRTYY